MIDNGSKMGQLTQSISEEVKDGILILLDEKKKEETSILESGTLYERIGAEFNLNVIKSLESKLFKDFGLHEVV